MYNKTIFICLAAFGVFFCMPGLGFGQSQNQNFWSETDLVPFRAGGSIGLSLSGYAVDGIENRRPPGVLQTFANLNFSTFGLNSRLSLNYSTDDSGFRQNMNNLSYNVSWRWLNVRAGDVSTRLSEFSLNGTPIRGGYIRATPGNFLVEIVGGRSRRAVRPSLDNAFREPSYEQWAFGGKIGVGRTGRNYLHLSTFYAQDNVASLESGQVEIKPKENLSVTPDFRVGFFDNRVNLESQVTFSVFTRDLNSGRISPSDLNIPGFVTAIYQPYVSTRVNYAGRAQASFRFNPFDLGIGYERIQPGFISLGLGSLRDDQQKMFFNPAFRFFNNRLSVQSNISFGKDNLLGTRLQTQSNTNIASSFQAVFSANFTLAGAYNLLLNDVTMNPQEGGGEELSAGGQSQTAHNILLQPNFTIIGDQITHNISFSGGYIHMENQVSGGGNMQDQAFLSTSYVGTVSYAITIFDGLSIHSSANYLTNDSGGSTINNFGVNLGTNYAFFNRALTLGVQLGHNRNKVERAQTGMSSIANRLQQYTAGVNAAYRLTDKDSFNVILRSRNNSVAGGTGNEFTEIEGSFRYQRTF